MSNAQKATLAEGDRVTDIENPHYGVGTIDEIEGTPCTDGQTYADVWWTDDNGHRWMNSRPVSKLVKQFSPKWNEYSFSVDFKALGPDMAPVFVVKIGNGYLRQTATTAITVVYSKRLATRYDSKIWALQISAFFEKSKVVRLLSKAEKDFRASGGRTWVHARTGGETPRTEPIVVETAPSDSGSDGGTT